MKKYFSYSELKQYLWDREKYIKQYIEGEEFVPNKEMQLGTIIHQAMADKKFDWLKELKAKGLYDRRKIVRKILDKGEKYRPKQSEITMVAKENDVSYLSIFDGLDKQNRELDEFKTSDKENWNQGIVDYHMQLSFYAYVYWLNCHQYFREIRLHYINTKKGTWQVFKTARSRRDLTEIKHKIIKVIDELHLQGLWDERLSREDRDKKNNLKINL